MLFTNFPLRYSKYPIRFRKLKKKNLEKKKFFFETLKKKF
jgi:hypothetical protein